MRTLIDWVDLTSVWNGGLPLCSDQFYAPDIMDWKILSLAVQGYEYMQVECNETVFTLMLLELNTTKINS